MMPSCRRPRVVHRHCWTLASSSSMRRRLAPKSVLRERREVPWPAHFLHFDAAASMKREKDGIERKILAADSCSSTVAFGLYRNHVARQNTTFSHRAAHKGARYRSRNLESPTLNLASFHHMSSAIVRVPVMGVSKHDGTWVVVVVVVIQKVAPGVTAQAMGLGCNCHWGYFHHGARTTAVIP